MAEPNPDDPLMADIVRIPILSAAIAYFICTSNISAGAHHRNQFLCFNSELILVFRI